MGVPKDIGNKGGCGSIGYMPLQRGNESEMSGKKNIWESKGTKRVQGVIWEITRGMRVQGDCESTGEYIGVPVGR